ncbi:MAG TPA: rhodanese-like domain-containing protein, partial [Desulfopila sp.]|nr:rhodanese-like domain-containing protein [Desulfopila sp.]
MKPLFSMRYWLTAAILALGVFWSLGSSAEKQQGYPNDSLIVDAQWLYDHSQDNNLVIVDVRTDKYFDGGIIPGAVRMPWSLFRYNDVGAKLAAKFVGVGEAQKILGEHGVS